LRRDFNLASNLRVRFVLKPAGPIAPHDAEVMRLLLGAERLEINPAYIPSKGTPSAFTPFGELYLPLEGLIDPAAERERLNKEIARIEQELAKVRAKLTNESFVNGAPESVIAEHRQREADWEQRLARLIKLREALG